MPEVLIDELKEKFKKLDFPSSEDFSDFLDSCYNYSLSGTATDA
jgi:hypothetical protein